MMDNISQFKRAAQFYGVPEVDLFDSNDLWEQKNIFAVTKTVFAVGRAVRKCFSVNFIKFKKYFLVLSTP